MGTVFVTGANRGIGLEFVRQFAADGWNVIATARNLRSAEALQSLADRHPGVDARPLDVTDYDGLAALAGELSGTPVDIVINNAAVFGPNRAIPTAEDLDGWREAFEVNTIAPLMVSAALLPNLRLGRRKLIVNLSSRVGSVAENTTGANTPYRSSKAALNQVNKSLSINLSGQGITVIVLHPGWVMTEMGGPNALITARDSVAGMRRFMDRAGPEENGGFFSWEGDPIPW